MLFGWFVFGLFCFESSLNFRISVDLIYGCLLLMLFVFRFVHLVDVVCFLFVVVVFGYCVVWFDLLLFCLMFIDFADG